MSAPTIADYLPAAATATLMALADDDLAAGHVLTSVAGFGPDLEINIALSSMGQDELGHARAYYGLALGPERDAINAAIFERDVDQFRAAGVSWVYAEAWERLVVKQYLFETADAGRRIALRTSPIAELVATVERMEGEEQYHIEFWTVWLDRTLRRGHDARHRVQAALTELWPHAAAWFDVPGVSAALNGGDLGPAGTEWSTATADALAAHGLEVPPETSLGVLGDTDAERVRDELTYVRRSDPGNW